MKFKTLCLILIMLCAVGCSVGLAGCQKYFWEYDCCWVCEEPKVELNKGCGSGLMTIDNVEYNFYTAQANNATDITFYIEKDGQHKVLWEADTVLKDGKLYLTITQDNISDYEGETIVLLQKTD